MKLVLLGDSLIYGYGVPRRDCWVRLAAERTGFELINRGVNGDTTGGMLARLGPHVLEERPAKVFLLGGANDILTAGNDLAARSNLSAMVYQALDAGVEPIVGLYPPFCPARMSGPWAGYADAGALSGTFSAYRAWTLRFVLSMGIKAVDFSTGFTGEELYLDEVHPNAAGHAVMAAVFCAALQRR